jgi:hypothetical protein
MTFPTAAGTLVNAVTTSNGVSATNSAGALTFTLGAITPTSIGSATTATTQSIGDNSTAIATDAFVQTAVTQPNILKDVFMGSVFQNVDGVPENVTLTASNDFIVTRELEIGVGDLVELPATSSLEIESFIDQPFFNTIPSPNVVGEVFNSNEGANVNVTLPINTDYISDVVLEVSPNYFLEIPNSSTIEVVTYFNQSNPPTTLGTSAITLGYIPITSSFGTGAVSATQITGLTTTVNIPAGGRNIKITVFGSNITNTAAASNNIITIWDGVVGSGTQIASSEGSINSANGFMPAVCFAIVNPTPQTKTYNAGLHTGGGTTTLTASSTSPAFILVEAI